MTTLNDFIENNYMQKSLSFPFFCTEKLATISSSLLPLVQDFKTTSPVKYTIPKNIKSRRNVQIVHPHSYIWMSNLLLNNVQEIYDFCSNSKFSKSNNLNFDGTNYFYKKDFSNLEEEKILYSSRYRYLLKLDFSRYYSSIYTHSIPWALHGKAVAKARRLDMTLLGNKIDKAVMRCCDGQTSGISIGPHTSEIVSEIIGSKIDNLISTKYPDLEGFRYLDDFYLYFNDVRDAEECLAYVRKIIVDFELELNDEKTGILKSPLEIEKDWVYSLRSYNHETDRVTRADIVSYFSFLFNICSKNLRDGVMRYGIKRSTSFDISFEDWSVYESFLLQSLIIDSRVMPEVVEILCKANGSSNFDLNIQKITDSVVNNIDFFSVEGKDFEISWLLFLSYKLEIELPEKISRILEKNMDNFVRILCLVLDEENLLLGFNSGVWEDLFVESELYGENWLFVYESIAKCLVPGKEQILLNDPFFEKLYSNSVEFINLDKRLDSLKVNIFDSYLGVGDMDDSDSYDFLDDEYY